MAGERFDYSNERRRHEKFVGRAALLARLDQLLVAEGPDRWVVVTGGLGMGKSALLATWLARREAAGAVVPHHFIRRGEYDWDDPAKLVGSLVAQLEPHFPGVRELDTEERRHPAARLAAVLETVSKNALVPRSERLVVLIDGLDEYEPLAGATAVDPLAAFLPHALPVGVSLLCASRPRHPYVLSLEARDGELIQIDLDDPATAADNDATVRAFWDQAAPGLELDAAFIDAAVVRAAGNIQHAVALRKHLVAVPAGQRRVEDIPRGLAALLERSWARIATDPIVVDGVGLLCAAREALTLDELGSVAGWIGDPQRRAFVRGGKELLLETQRPDGQYEYRPQHASIRAHVASALGTAVFRGYHAALARRLANWPILVHTSRRYALRHALTHRAEAGEWIDAWRTAADMAFLEAKCRELGVHEAEADVARTAERCRASGEIAISGRFDGLARALARESHWLQTSPEGTAALVWNRLRRWGWSAEDIDEQLRIPAKAPFLRVRQAATRESPSLIRDLVGHSDSVNACAIVGDGLRMVSGSSDGTLKVWELDGGRVLASLEGHADEVRACAVTDDGRRAVSASADRTLKVWDLDSGNALITMEGHTDWVTTCTVTTKGDRRVVSGSEDGTLKVWYLDSGRLSVTMEGHTEGVRACAVTADNRRVVSGGCDGTLKVWDLDSGRVLGTFEGHSDWVTACAITADGRRLVSASHDNTLKVWDLDSGALLATLNGHLDWIRACAVTADGRCVVSASDDRTLKVWDLESGQTLASLEGHADWINACAVTLDGRRLVSASDDGTLKVWDLEGRPTVVALDGHTGRVNGCAAMADGTRAVSASDDGTLKVWDTVSGRALTTFGGHIGGVAACAVTTDGRRIISGAEDGTLMIWNADSGRRVITLEGHAERVFGCAVTADGLRVVSAAADRRLKVWDTRTSRSLIVLKGHAGAVVACAITMDGHRVVSASDDRTLKVWDLATGRVLASLNGHTNCVSACAVVADGRRVVSASDDRTLKVWDLENGRVLATLEGHAAPVKACAVTEDGRRVVSASADRTLRVWDLDTYMCLFTHRGDVAYAAVAATATTIVAGDVTGAVWFLDWPLSDRRAVQVGTADRENHQHASRPGEDNTSSRSTMKKHTILFLAANPTGTNPLKLGEEARAIQVELERSGYRDCFELETRWAAQPLDLLRELRRLKPTVVHFSGHCGSSSGGTGVTGRAPSHDVVSNTSPAAHEPRGLFFQGGDGRAQVVTAQALHDVFGAAGASVKVVVLNACYSEPQADSLLAHVDCVVGMSGSIDDAAARNFAIGFYGGLGERESIVAAYQQGRAAISLEGLPDGDLPKLKVRDGVDAAQVVLAADPR
jgi:WD40 repeat protein